MLTGGFNNGELVKVVEHIGVREQPEMFSAHELGRQNNPATCNIIDLARTDSMLIVRCDYTGRLVFLIFYRGKCMFANCILCMNAEVHSCQQYSIENLARCLALPANQPHMLHQRYKGCDTTSALFKIIKRIAYDMLVVTIRHLLYLAEVGQSSGVTNGLATAKMYTLLLCDVKISSCQSLNQLRYNYASKSDKSASLFPPTNCTFQQYTIKCQVAFWIQNLEAKLVV